MFSCSALDDGNVEEAHHIHVSLMVDFVAEVGIDLLLNSLVNRQHRLVSLSSELTCNFFVASLN